MRAIRKNIADKMAELVAKEGQDNIKVLELTIEDVKELQELTSEELTFSPGQSLGAFMGIPMVCEGEKEDEVEDQG